MLRYKNRKASENRDLTSFAEKTGIAGGNRRGEKMIEFYETTYDMTAKHNSDLEPVLFGFEDCRP